MLIHKTERNCTNELKWRILKVVILAFFLIWIHIFADWPTGDLLLALLHLLLWVKTTESVELCDLKLLLC